MLRLLEELIGEKEAILYLGGYGIFDDFSFSCARAYKKLHAGVKLAFVTPYLNEEYQKRRAYYRKDGYDVVIYPPLENVPPKFAIVQRNKWMAEQADAVIAFIDHGWGGAYRMYQHAKRKNKAIYNLAEKEI